jgi:hypothetical protein
MKRNKWVWEEDDLMVGPVTMHCEHCARKTKMHQDRAGNLVIIDDINDLLTVQEAKRFLETKGFIVKNAVTFTDNG